MIVRLFCPKCAHEVLKSLVDYAEVEAPLPVTKLTDDGTYEVRCGRGHISSVRLLNAKFELLFEMGLNALVDGYGREAVSSFAASLERFYEFYWRCVTRQHLKRLSAAPGSPFPVNRKGNLEPIFLPHYCWSTNCRSSLVRIRMSSSETRLFTRGIYQTSRKPQNSETP
jgi:hypothetical protein